MLCCSLSIGVYLPSMGNHGTVKRLLEFSGRLYRARQ